MKHAIIYVPSAAAELTIAPGSGIVAMAGGPNDESTPMSRVYFEGNVYDADNLREYTARIKQAAGRLFQRYPTVAVASYTADEMKTLFVAVGTVSSEYEVKFDDAEAKAAAYAYAGQVERPARSTMRIRP